MSSNEIHRITVEGKPVLAWGCGCGEDKPGERKGIVRFEEPVRGIDYGVVHLCCIEPAKD